MRIELKSSVMSGALLALALLLAGWPAARGQRSGPQTLERSAARAREILDQAVQALGGEAYLNVRDSDCTARLGSFSNTGEAGGSIEVRILRLGGENRRIEFRGNNYITNIYFYEVHGRGNLTNVYTADQGWTRDSDGVTELQPEAIADYKEQLQTDLHMILRTRLDEPGLTLRYAGTEVVDLKQVDWVEISDSEGHLVRVPIDRSTHLPVRSVVISRDPDTGARSEDTTTYTRYRRIDGIQTALRTARLINGQLVSQAFYDRCRYNRGLSPELFTRAGLDMKAPD
jgi:hypothetical protein